MMNFFKTNKLFNFIFILFIIYSVTVFYKQFIKLQSYNKDLEYYSLKIEELNEEKKDLLSIQENVNSSDYIEKVARENLEMYLPNERVYVDISK